MKKIFKKIFGPIANFFNRMGGLEAERTIDMYSQIFEVEPNEGGGNKKIKTNARQVRKLCSNN